MNKEENNTDVLQYRRLLFSIAYNMTGSIMDAEDLVQDTYTYWFNMDISRIEKPKYYLIKAITNRCINYLQESRKKRETYIGTWLPEPIVEKKADAAPLNFDKKNELSIGFLYVLEKLNPLERAVLILKESFNLPYAELSRMFDITEDNCRQLLSRAKLKLKGNKTKFKVDEQKHSKLLYNFLKACEKGNMEELTTLLKEDVVLYTDGGGKVSAALSPLYSKDRVVKFIQGILKKTGQVSKVEVALVNGISGAVVYIRPESKIPDLVIALDIAEQEDKIQYLYFIRNPDKLRHVPEE